MPANYEIPGLAGKRISLRPIEPEEEAVVHRWTMESDPLTQTCRPPILRPLARRAKRRRRMTDPSQGNFAIIMRGTETLVGKIRYFDLNPRNRSAEIGYILSSDARGKGFGKDAIGLLVGYLFDGLGLNKVYAQTAAFNTSSIKLLESSGFQRDGVLREHHLYQGVLHDDHLYSLLLRDWKERGPRESPDA